MAKDKNRFYIKLVNIEDGKARVVLIRDSENGKPVAEGLLIKLEGAARTTFRDAMLALDGGTIVSRMVDTSL